MGDASSPPPTSTRNDAEIPAPKLVPIRILTHNVRYATDTPDETEWLWPDRFPYLSSHFKYHTRPHFAPQTTIVCMQEVLREQLLDLHSKTFNTPILHSTNGHDDNDWAYVGVGRDDGQTKGEYSPIFFRKSAWNCIHSDTIWLNETGEKGQKGWDAGSVRILTYAALELVPSSDATNRPTGVILAMNTHLDNEGERSRRESAKLIIELTRRLWSEYSPFFTFLCGDLNSEPSGDAYKILNAHNSGYIDTRRILHHDLRKDTGKVYAQGNELTFTGFPGDAGAIGRERIDFIHLGTEIADGLENDWASEEAALTRFKDIVHGYGVLPNRFDDRVWLSDHRAVVVDLLVPL
ncbi:hypothetical protein H2200_002251 [Cladophialophora chaetospira]|uniref:Endonuclease/exonuclease/phosphatase domain-containing protein n=1 Tax=Cladophialophora chaetospira TaxID=386627 RepID=A0AA38XIJ0_9EURO|nr:hypothetical protein H2200_002251 [Cladophialophora chaetospira]